MATKTFKIGLSATDKQNMAQDVYEEVLALTFAEYDGSKTYNTGDFVVYENALYQCKADNTTGTWDSSKWESATLQDLLDDVEGAVASVSGKADIVSLENGTLVVAKSLTSKQIENVSDESGSTQDAPFNFQATGTDNNTTETPTAPIAKHLELRGNTVAWNQLFYPRIDLTTTINGLTITHNSETGVIHVQGTTTANTNYRLSDTTYSLSLLSSHTYLLKGLKTSGSQNTIDLRFSGSLQNKYDTGNGIIFTGLTDTGSINLYVKNGETVNFDVIPQFVDLTLLGKEYDSVLEFVRDYPLPYYSYNAGELKSASSGKLITIGYNAFDGNLQLGFINQTTGEVEINNSNVIPTDFIKVVAGQTYSLEAIDSTNRNRIIYEYDENKNYIKNDYLYYPTVSITLSNETHYVKFVYPNNDLTRKISFHLTWDSSRTGYEEYEEWQYKLPNVELRSAGNAYDELKADGTLITRVGSYTFTGNETWEWFSEYNFWSCANLLPEGQEMAYPTDNKITSNGVVVSPITGGRTIRVTTADNPTINGSTNMATLFASGTKLYYELDTPTETTDETKAFTENIEVDDFGTMEFVPASGNVESASNPIVPQGNQFFYPADYVLLIDDLNNYLNENEADTTDLVLRKELLPKLASNSEDGTYTLKATKSGSTITYAWVKDE